jgi:hypothetical protein
MDSASGTTDLQYIFNAFLSMAAADLLPCAYQLPLLWLDECIM